jgi:hypothetical protein
VRTLKAVVVAVLAIALFSSLPVLAQFPGGAQRNMGTGKAARPAQSRDQPADIGAPVQIQLDKLEDDLKLAPEQQGAWNAYADKILKFADDMTRAQFMARTGSVSQDATAAQQLDQLTDRARNRMTAMEDIAQFGKALYAVLTTDQRKIADRRLVLPMLSLANGLPAPGMATGSPGR